MLASILKQYWGYDGFLPLQEEAMKCVMQHRDSVVVLPTGGGKSLCFQAPAMCLPGMAVVVSPLISLMKDQVDALRQCGIGAAYINSTLTPLERRQVADDIRAGRIKLVYVAPERLVQERTIEYLKTVGVSLIAIDEAHCISEWGHDFRPEYRALRLLKENFPNVGIHAFTATATLRVRSDIAEQLGLTDPALLVGSFDRPNLIYRVERRSQLLDQIRAILDRHKGESGIIYCMTRADVDNTHAALKELGYRTRPYHAGMNDNDRHRNQEAFIEEKVDTIIATIAFGMGIDKSNVRYVIHAGMPKTLENYQQESGRAGRDGLEAECCLIYGGGDIVRWKKMIAGGEAAVSDAALKSLDAIYGYCTQASCRHRSLVRYFGQDLPGEACQACDVCLGDVDLVPDALIVGQKILSSVVRQGENFGGDYTSMVLKGSKEQRILQNGHDKLSTYGLLADVAQKAIRDWIEQLVGQGFLVKAGEYNVLQVTPLGRRLLKGEVTPRLLQPVVTKDRAERRESVADDSWEGVDRGLFEDLRTLRREIADERHVPPYVVFADVGLRDMARRRPTTLAGFLQVKGVGEKKCEDFGDQFVAHIVEYCQTHELTTDVVAPAAAAAPRPVRRTDGPSVSAIAAFPHFRSGLSVAETAQRMNRATSTVNGYLQEYLQHAQIVDATPWVSSAAAQRIEAAVQQVGDERLRPIFDLLEGQVPFEDIRVVVTCLRNRATVQADVS